MKFDPLVKVENEKLVNIADGKEISTEIKVFDVKEVIENSASYEAYVSGAEKFTLIGVKLNQNQAELSPETPDEELLARLRDQLKKLEEKQIYSVIIAVRDEEISDAEAGEVFINSMVHAARRIKDCESVAGFSIAARLLEKDKGSAIDENSWTMWFMNDMNKKHGHYVYFASSEDLQNNDLNAESSKNNIVSYKTV